MEVKVQVPFQQILRLVKTLTPSQKAKLRQELNKENLPLNSKDDFIDFLLKGPVYNEKDISIIEDNRKSIAAWRTKN